MLYMEIIAVSSEIRKKHINTQCGQKVEICFNVKPGSTQSNSWPEGLISLLLFIEFRGVVLQ